MNLFEENTILYRNPDEAMFLALAKATALPATHQSPSAFSSCDFQVRLPTHGSCRDPFKDGHNCAVSSKLQTADLRVFAKLEGDDL